jgi:hypothetical protein
MLVAIPTTTVGMTALTFAASGHWKMAVSGLIVTALVLLIITFVIAGEPLGPSRRVRVHWDRSRAGPLRRFLGPGILRAASLVLIVGLVGLAAETGLGAFASMQRGGAGSVDDATRVLFMGLYLAGFHAFLVGFASFCRARSKTGTTPRLLLLGALFLAVVGPWIVMAVGGVLTDGGDATYLLAAPSPTYVPIVVFNWVGTGRAGLDLVLLAGGASALGWAALGMGLLGAASVRTRRVILEHRTALARVEAMLAAEDAPPPDDEPVAQQPVLAS